MSNLQLWAESCGREENLSLYKLEVKGDIELYLTKKAYWYRGNMFYEPAVFHIWNRAEDKALLSSTNQSEAYAAFNRYAKE